MYCAPQLHTNYDIRLAFENMSKKQQGVSTSNRTVDHFDIDDEVSLNVAVVGDIRANRVP